MSLLKTWKDKKCPTFKISKNLISGDLVIVSDTRDFLEKASSDHLEEWQIKEVQSHKKQSQFTFVTADKMVHLVLVSDKKDEFVGGFESCAYYALKKAFGNKLSFGESDFNLIVDKDFKNADLTVKAFADALCCISYAYKNKERVNLNVFIESKWKKTFEEQFLKSEAVNFARYLVDLPPNELNPTTYANLIKDLVSGSKDFKFESISKDLEKEGYGLIHAVGKGSANPPQLVRVLKKGKGKKIAIVGKGITYDTGGLDLKPSKFMRNMKKDMGGSAAVAGTLYHNLKTKGNSQPIDFYFAMAENSVGANSFRPGDVCKAGNGLTVEIDNTDAEGRLALADALSWLGKSSDLPETIVDIATLTGAIKVGLGSHIGGIFSNDQALSDSIFKTATANGDFMWPMPMPYWSESEMTRTDMADLVNSSASGYGGAITAAQFINFFVPKKTKWAHLDIYSWVEAKRDALRHSGGSGQGVLLLIDWLENGSSK